MLKSLMFNILIIFFLTLKIEAQPSFYKSSEGLMQEAIAHFDGGRYRQSLPLLEEAIRINVEGRLSDILYYYRALVQYRLENYEAMYFDLDTAISFEGQKGHYYYYRAIAALSLERSEQALKDLKKATTLSPTHDAAWCKYGIVLQQAGQQREALIAYQQALSININNADAHYFKGLLLLQLGLPQEGCAHLEQALRLRHPLALRDKMGYCE